VRDASADVRLKAAWALGQVRDPAALPVLRDALAREADPRTRRALVRALVHGGGRSEPALAALLQSGDPQVREAAVRGLVGRDALGPWPWPWPRPRPFP
jgi:HEAT repeat protein